MLILHLTDIHGAFDNIHQIPDLERADLIVLSGDITHFGGVEAIHTCLNELKFNKVIAVTGNCDYPEVEEYLAKEKTSITGEIKQINGIQFVGINGSLPCPGKTPIEFSDDQFAQMLKEIESKLIPELPIILVSHQPPYNTINDRLTNGIHVGSQAIREFIQKVKPLLCLTGHIHEGAGVDKIGETIIVNPAPLRSGFYALIDIGEDFKVNVEVKTI